MGETHPASTVITLHPAQTNIRSIIHESRLAPNLFRENLRDPGIL
jgi:hypothetical protein